MSSVCRICFAGNLRQNRVESTVCRICLAGNLVFQNRVINDALLNIYEKLSNAKFNSEDASPRVLCSVCYRKLLKCLAFFHMTRRSEKILSQFWASRYLKSVPNNVAIEDIHLK